LLKRL